MDVLDEIRGLQADLARFRRSSPPPPFDDGFLLLFGIPSQKGGVHMRALFALVFVFRGRVFLCWLELVKLFRLYLGASLCTLLFQLLPYLLCFIGIFMIGGVYLFYMILVSNCLLTYVYMFFTDICLYCVLF